MTENERLKKLLQGANANNLQLAAVDNNETDTVRQHIVDIAEVTVVS